VLRLRMPDEDITWTDLVRGEITFAAGSVPDYVVVRGNGKPLYPLVNPVDDALMKITHVLRGEDLLSSTPRQIALYRALVDIGVADEIPQFGHLPYVMGEGNKKLSKRDPESSLNLYRERGFVPEGLLNYLALLGWSIAEDRDIFSPAELVEAFDGTGISANPARFDLKKAEAINATHLRLLPPEDFTARLTTYLAHAHLIADPPTRDETALVAAAAPLVQERITTLAEAVGMLAFLFTPERDFAPESEAAAKNLAVDAVPTVNAAAVALEALSTWDAASIETALKESLVEGLGLKPRKAFAPVRVAVTGRTVSPPLYESMELLGRERTLARLRRALA
jgi:glutamyl-tRNA synthetase